MDAVDWAKQVIALERIMRMFDEAIRDLRDEGAPGPLVDGVNELHAHIKHCERMMDFVIESAGAR